jgi:hypothetical protein
MFAANRDPSLPIAAIGMGGQVQPQSASFAKGRFFVELVVTAANPNSDRTAALQAFAAGIDGRLEGRATAPEALGWFLKEDLLSTRLVPESVLGLRLLKRGYVAKYKQGQAFIVIETSPESATEVLKKLREPSRSRRLIWMGSASFARGAPSPVTRTCLTLGKPLSKLSNSRPAYRKGACPRGSKAKLTPAGGLSFSCGPSGQDDQSSYPLRASASASHPRRNLSDGMLDK